MGGAGWGGGEGAWWDRGRGGGQGGELEHLVVSLGALMLHGGYRAGQAQENTRGEFSHVQPRGCLALIPRAVVEH